MKEETLHFCTLFDSNYLTRGLATYFSLVDQCQNFLLYIVAFDDKSFEILTKLNLPKIVLISLKDFEDPELLKVKTERTRQEYCWTCSSSLILYVIEKYNLNMCTYIDADLIFFDDPMVLIDEMGDKSILLTEHKLPEGSKKEEINGKYCVQFMTFKNDNNGMTALNWWRERCLEWCYAKHEDGKYGDQKYLDNWTDLFQGVHVLKHIGGGVAPWNVRRYKISNEKGKLFVKEKGVANKLAIIFYHFQSTQIYNFFTKIIAVYWPYDPNVNEEAAKIYKIYGKYLNLSLKTIRDMYPDFNLGFDDRKNYIIVMFKKFKVKIKKLVI